MDISHNTILEPYYPLIQIYQDIAAGKQPRVKFIFLIGGRYSGKTYAAEEFQAWLFMTVDNVVNNVLRKTQKEVKKQKIQEIKNILNKYDFVDYDFCKGDLEFKSKLNYNKIRLDSLNPEDNNVNEGGKIDLPIESRFTKGISNFYEEVSQLLWELYNQHNLSSRAANTTFWKVVICAANPYQRNQWYIDLCERLLPSNEEELYTNGYQFGYFPDYNNGDGAIVIRTNYRCNPYCPQQVINDLEAIRDIDYERYKVVGLGMPGATQGAIYQLALSKMAKVNKHAPFESGALVAGYDHGWADSDSSLEICNIDLYKGIDFVAEKSWVHKENKDKASITTNWQIDECIKTCKHYIDLYKKPMRVYVDNAHLIDFYDLFNQRLAINGVRQDELCFYPASKQGKDFGVPQRIEFWKYMLSVGMLRVDIDACPMLINDLRNGTYEEVKTPHEGQLPKRNHEYTHYINAAEYAVCEYMEHFKELNALYFTK